MPFWCWGRISPRQRPCWPLTLRQLVHRKAARIAEKVRLPAWNDAGIREIAQQEKENLFIAAPYATKLDDVALKTLQAAPDDLARFGAVVAHVLTPDLPAVTGLPSEHIAGGKRSPGP